MAYREVAVTEVHEVLRQWIAGAGTRTAGRFAGVDRKTARRYIEAAVALGVHRDGSTAQLTDELIGAIIGAVRPGAEPSWGHSREVCRAHEVLIRGMVEDGLTLTRVHELLARKVGPPATGAGTPDAVQIRGLGWSHARGKPGGPMPVAIDTPSSRGWRQWCA